MASQPPTWPGPAADAPRLAATLGGLRDPALRAAWTRDTLERLGAASACELLDELLRAARERHPEQSDLLLWSSVYLCSPEGLELRRAIATLAQIRALHDVHLLLAEPELRAGGAERRAAPAVPDFGAARPLSLGERKSLARKRDRDLLSRVLRDPDPDVTRILLDNSAVTEEDVLRLSALRPVAPEVLSAVFLHPRWVVRYPVRLSLALNPHTPELVVVQLLPHLTVADRRQVWRSGHISGRVREACGIRPADAPVH